MLYQVLIDSTHKTNNLQLNWELLKFENFPSSVPKKEET